MIKNTSYKVAILTGLTLYIVGCTLFFPGFAHGNLHHVPAAIFADRHRPELSRDGSEHLQFDDRPEKPHATLRLNISQTFIRLCGSRYFAGKYLVFFRWRKSEKQMAGMNAEQIHNFKVLMLENTP